jgi:transposase-like protein
MKSAPTSRRRAKRDRPDALDLRTAFGAELRRMLERAVRHPDHQDIHAIRKGVIQLRSWLRLVRETMGRHQYDAHNRRLRRISRRLAPVRDARGMLKALATISPATAFPNTRRHLLRRERRAEKTVAMAMRHVKRGLERELAACDRLRPEKIPRADFNVALARLRAEMNAALAAARDAGRTELLHTWRKRVKNYQHALAFVADKASRGGSSAIRLRRLLGQDHDLALLKAELADRADNPETPALLALIAARRAQLRTQLFPR